MSELAAEFDDKIGEYSDDEKRAYKQITAAIKNKAKHTVHHKRKTYADLEALLATVRSLRDLPDNFPHPFLNRNAFGNVEESCLESLEEKIRTFIRKSMAPETSKLGYLHPLASIARALGGLDVFSVNYDTCVEQVCDDLDVSYTDGFGARWDAKLLDDHRHLVRLHKLHGSVNWFETKGTISKMHRFPVVGNEPEDASGNQGLSELMVYPLAPKGSLQLPWLDLFNRLDKALSVAQVCIVIGYSFRDSYVADAFLRNMVRNPRLMLLIVDQNAAAALARLLDLTDQPTAAMQLAARCRLLPLNASKALSHDKVYYEVRDMRLLTEEAEEVLRNPEPYYTGQAPRIKKITDRLLETEWYTAFYTWLIERRKTTPELIAMEPTDPHSLAALAGNLLCAACAGDKETADIMRMEFRHHYYDSIGNGELYGNLKPGKLILNFQSNRWVLNMDYLPMAAAAAESCAARIFAWHDQNNEVRELLLELADVFKQMHDEFSKRDRRMPVKTTNSWGAAIEPYWHEVEEFVESKLKERVSSVK